MIILGKAVHVTVSVCSVSEVRSRLQYSKFFNFLVWFLQAKKFYHVGQLIAISLVNGGSGFPYMAPPMYQYLCGVDMSENKVSLEDVPSFEVKEMLQKVSQTRAYPRAHTIMISYAHLLLTYIHTYNYYSLHKKMCL